MTDESLRATPAGRNDPALLICAVALGIVVAVAFVRDLSLLFVRMPFSPNEGWNAYYADNAFRGGLYPNPPSMMYNNYPPLSFLLVGAFGKLIGDNIFAGRIIALASTVATTLLVSMIARRMKCGRIECVLSALLFAASPWVLTDYAFFDDPQFLGQALGTAGFMLVLTQSERDRTVAPGTFLLVAAGFIKHIFVAQPVALTIWLWRYRPHAAISFVLVGAALTAAGIMAADFAFRTSLLAHIASPRIYEFTRTLGHPATWLITEAIPLGVTLWLLRYSGDRYAELCAIYAIVAVGVGVLLSGGQGVGGNALFDASIAVALGAGVLLDRLHKGSKAPRWLGENPARKIAIACAAPMAIVLAASMFAPRPPGSSIIKPLAPDEAAAASDIAFVADHKGPAFCEALAFCYWARKAPEVDAFGLPEAFKRHMRSTSDLTRLLDAHYFSTVQLNPRSLFAYSAELRCAFARDYRIDHTDAFGQFLLPRDGSAPANHSACR